LLHEPEVRVDLRLRQVVEGLGGEGVEDELQLAPTVDQIDVGLGLAGFGDGVIAVALAGLVVGDNQVPGLSRINAVDGTRERDGPL
jgi:hypothetical protein